MRKTPEWLPYIAVISQRGTTLRKVQREIIWPVTFLPAGRHFPGARPDGTDSLAR